MEIASVVAILAGLAVIITFVWNVFFGQRTIGQLLSSRSTRPRNAGADPIRHNLPQRLHRTLWGRENEIEKIHKLLYPYPASRYHILAIEGIAGIGKSALALEVAQRIKEGKYPDQSKVKFDAIVWATAKPDVLSPEGIRSRDSFIRLIDDVYAAIALTLDEPQILQAKREHQAELVRRVLANHHVLLILDNIDILSDERIVSFIREVPDPTKVILTTRYRVDVAFAITLQGLDVQSSLALMQNEAQWQEHLNLSNDVTFSIYEKTGGVPLAMVWTIGRLRLGYKPEIVLRDLANPSSDISRFCFEQTTAEIRGKKVWELLYAISLFRKGAIKDSLKFIMSENFDLDEGLVLLTRLSLINQNEGRFTSLQLTRTYVQEVVERETPELGKYLKSQFVDCYTRLLRDQVGPGYWAGRLALNTWSRFGVVIDEIDEVQEAIYIAYDQNRWEVVRDLVFGIVHILWVLDRWEQRIELTHMAIHAVKQLGSLVDEAWLRIDALGFIYLAQGDYENGTTAVKEGLAIAESSGINDAIVLGLCYTARILAHFGDFEEAHKCLTRASNIPADERHRRRIETTAMLITGRAPRIDHMVSRIPASRQELQRQRKQLDEKLAQAKKLRSNEELTEAREMLRLAEKIEDDIGDLELRARIRLELGLLELDCRNYEEGEAILRDVREIFEFLGKNDEVSTIKMILMKSQRNAARK